MATSRNRNHILHSSFTALLASIFFISLTFSPLAYAVDMEAVLDSADGTSVFEVQDSATTEVFHIDSDGNVVTKGCVRIDGAGVECSEAEGLVVDGNVGIGTVNPLSILQVTGNVLRVGLGGTLDFANGDGDLYVQNDIEVDGIIYSTNITGSGITDLGAASSFEIPNSGAPTTDAAGEVALDTTVANNQPMIQYYDGDENLYVVAMPTGNFADLDGYVVTYNATNDEFELSAGPTFVGGGWLDGSTDVYLATTSDLVGIGTTDPDAALEIIESGEAPLMVSLAPAGNGDLLLVDSAGRVGIGTTVLPEGTGLSVMNGNVGIGTFSPTALFAVGDTSPFTITSTGIVDAGAAASFEIPNDAAPTTDAAGEIALDTTVANNQPMIQYYDGDENLYVVAMPTGNFADLDGYVVAYNATNDEFELISGPSFQGGGWNDGGTNVFLADTSDTVGIGTTTPGALLELVESGEAPLMISSDPAADGDFLLVNSTGSVGIGTTLMTDSTALSVMNGNVGIGTWNPTAALEVSGNIRTLANGSLISGLHVTADADSVFQWNGRSTMASASDGVIKLANTGNTDFTRLQFGGTTSAFPAIGRNGTALSIQAADGSLDARLGIGTTLIPASTGLSVMSGNVGIGTWSPRAALAVGPAGTIDTLSGSDDIYVQDDLEVDGTATTAALTVSGTSTLAAVAGAVDAGGASSLEIPNSGAPTTDAAGEIALDTTVANNQPMIQYYDGDENLYVVAMPTGNFADLDGYVVTYNATNDEFELSSGPTMTGGGWNDGGTNVFLADTTDLVGIGTTTPSGLLELVESGEAPLMISSGPTGDGDFLIIKSDGNVGIGTANPNADFEVNGTLALQPGSVVDVDVTGLTVLRALMRVQGDSGAVDITANPQIVDGTVDGEIVTLLGDSDTNTLKFDDGTGLRLQSGVSFTMGAGDTMTLMYDRGDDLWTEISRTDN